MTRIENDSALELLRGLGLPYVMEWDTLNFAMENGEETDSYLGDDVLITVNKSDTPYMASVIPLISDPDIDKAVGFIRETYESSKILFNMQSLSNNAAKELTAKYGNRTDRYIYDYAYTKAEKPVLPQNVRLLTADDGEICASFEEESIPTRPNLSALLRYFVVRENGYILGCFDGDRLVGYLSYTAITDTVYDVDFVCVTPKMRGRGIGKILAVSFAAEAKARGRTPYWSNAQNDASANTALSCGYTLIRHVMKF